jgi:DNA repair exonuclease SbcCD ATPase subunit
MLEQLNANIVKYSSRLGLSINFTVDVSGKTKRFETVCKMQDGTIRKYSSLSGGEKTRVDISIAFGMFDLLKSSKVSFNVLFLDEVFENLDLEGVEEAFEIIRVLAEDSAVYLVTFNMVDSLGVKTYTFDKTDGTTKIH